MANFFCFKIILSAFLVGLIQSQNGFTRDNNFIPSQSQCNTLLLKKIFLVSISRDSLVENGPLPGLQRVPSTFQGFIGSGSRFMTNGLDLETFTKNSAIRANQVCFWYFKLLIKNFRKMQLSLNYPIWLRYAEIN